MWRVKTFVVMLLLLSLPAVLPAQDIAPILNLTGAVSVEELDPYEVERLGELLARPLPLNHVSESRLKESGLFSHYQSASLIDYRSRHGDVLSFNELAAVDGFGHDFVSRIAPFVSLESNRLPGASPYRSVMNNLEIRSSLKPGAPLTYGMKYRLEVGETLSGGISISRTSSSESFAPEAYSGNVSYNFRRRSAKILIGDFNARFGQGLALWNGMSLSGLTSALSFMRKPSGITASSSFTGGYAMRGVAGDVRVGRVKISVMNAFAEKKETLSFMPAVNVACFFRSGMISLTHYADFAVIDTLCRIPDMKTSADFAFTVRGTDIFAETAFDWISLKPAALAGVVSPLGDDVRLAAMLRYYPTSFTPSRSAAARSTTKCSNEYAASVAADFSAGRRVDLNGAEGFGSSVRRHSGKISADFAYFPEVKSKTAVMKSVQLKAHTEWTFMISGSFRTTLKFSERIRTWGEPFRTDVRGDFSYMSKYFVANLRINALRSNETGLLAYAEGGYTGRKLNFYARAGIFRIDKWDDRIYVYERDAPGAFNVPAYYGRGLWAALNMNWRFAGWGRIYVRAAMTSYPFMAQKKPGRAELKIHFVFRL